MRMACREGNEHTFALGSHGTGPIGEAQTPFTSLGTLGSAWRQSFGVLVTGSAEQVGGR